MTGARRTAFTANLLPRWRLDPRMHLSRCPIFGVHFYSAFRLSKKRDVIIIQLDLTYNIQGHYFGDLLYKKRVEFKYKLLELIIIDGNELLI